MSWFGDIIKKLKDKYKPPKKGGSGGGGSWGPSNGGGNKGGGSGGGGGGSWGGGSGSGGGSSSKGGSSTKPSNKPSGGGSSRSSGKKGGDNKNKGGSNKNKGGSSKKKSSGGGSSKKSGVSSLKPITSKMVQPAVNAVSNVANNVSSNVSSGLSSARQAVQSGIVRPVYAEDKDIEETLNNPKYIPTTYKDVNWGTAYFGPGNWRGLPEFGLTEKYLGGEKKSIRQAQNRKLGRLANEGIPMEQEIIKQQNQRAQEALTGYMKQNTLQKYQPTIPTSTETQQGVPIQSPSVRNFIEGINKTPTTGTQSPVGLNEAVSTYRSGLNEVPQLIENYKNTILALIEKGAMTREEGYQKLQEFVMQASSLGKVAGNELSKGTVAGAEDSNLIISELDNGSFMTASGKVITPKDETELQAIRDQISRQNWQGASTQYTNAKTAYTDAERQLEDEFRKQMGEYDTEAQGLTDEEKSAREQRGLGERQIGSEYSGLVGEEKQAQEADLANLAGQETTAKSDYATSVANMRRMYEELLSGQSRYSGSGAEAFQSLLGRETARTIGEASGTLGSTLKSIQGERGKTVAFYQKKLDDLARNRDTAIEQLRAEFRDALARIKTAKDKLALNRKDAQDWQATQSLKALNDFKSQTAGIVNSAVEAKRALDSWYYNKLNPKNSVTQSGNWDTWAPSS